MDFKAIVGTALTLAGALSLGLAAVGKQQAADAVEACRSAVETMSPDLLAQCKSASKEVGAATKEVLGGALTTLGSFLNLFGRARR